MANYHVINPKLTELTNVNAGGTDIPAGKKRIADLTAAECATTLAAGGVLVPTTLDYEGRREAARIMKYQKLS